MFQESFEGFEATPPDSVKIAIDREIGGKNRKMWWLLAILFLLTTTVVGALLLSKDETTRTNQNTKLASTGESSELSAENDSPEGSGVFKDTRTSEHRHQSKSIRLNSDNTKKKSIVGSEKQSGILNKQDHTTGSKQKQSTKVGKQTSDKQAKKSGKIGKGGKQNHSGQNNLSATTGSENSSGTISASGNGSSGTNSDGNATGNATAKTNEEPTKSDSTKTVAETSKDSLVNKLPDSSESAGTTASNSNPPPKKTSPALWMASLYFGPQFDIQHSKYDYKSLKAAASFRPSLEINRSLVAGYGLTTGVGYNALNETYTYTTSSIDTASTWLDSIPIFDQNDSIVGYTYFTNYDLDTTVNNYPLSSKVSTVFIPIYLTKHFEFNNDWGLLINAGATFRISSITSPTDSFPESLPVQHKTGVMLSGRIQATYTKENWMFSAGFNGGYYLKPHLEYYEFDKPRYFFSPQVGIHYRF